MNQFETDFQSSGQNYRNSGGGGCLHRRGKFHPEAVSKGDGQSAAVKVLSGS